MSVAAIKAQLAKVGEDPVLQAEKQKTDEAQAAISSLNPASINPRSFQATVDEGTDAISAEIDLGDLTELNLSPDLISMTEQIMGILENPTAGAIASLQSLADSTGIKPPGIGLPSIPSPIAGIASVALKVSGGGGFDINSALSAADSLLQQPSLSAVETMLPDIGIDAPTDLIGEIPGGLSQQGVSGGLTNPFKAYGNIQFKNGFNKEGNPIKIPFELGLPAVIPRGAPRTEPPAPKPPYLVQPEYTGGTMRENSAKVPPAYQSGVIYDDDGNPVHPAVAKWMDGVLKKGGVSEGINRDLSGLPPDNPGKPDIHNTLPYNTKLVPDLPTIIEGVDNSIFGKQIKNSGAFGEIFNLENVNGETDVAALIGCIDITALPQSGVPQSEDSKAIPQGRGQTFDPEKRYTRPAQKGPQGSGDVRSSDNMIKSGRTGAPETDPATPEQAKNLEKIKDQLFPGFGT